MTLIVSLVYSFNYLKVLITKLAKCNKKNNSMPKQIEPKFNWILGWQLGGAVAELFGMEVSDGTAWCESREPDPPTSRAAAWRTRPPDRTPCDREQQWVIRGPTLAAERDIAEVQREY